MKILFFSDLHIYNHFAKTIFEDTAQRFLIHLLAYCKAQGITKVVFLGDWFHLKNKIQVPSYIKSYDLLEEFKANGIEFIFIIGNHDMPQADTTDFSIIHSFKDYGKVISCYDWVDVDNVRFHCLSYTKQLPNFEYDQDRKNILCSHLDINNFLMENNFICNNGFSISEFNKFDLVFSGHYHKHQIINNIIYIGSPYQVRFSERFDQKGFVVLDTSTLKWTFENYGDAPVFKEIVDIDNANPEDVKGNFVRIKTHKGNKDLSKIKEELIAAGAESVDFIFENEDESQELNIIEDLATGSMKELAEQFIKGLLETKSFPTELKSLVEAGDVNKDDFIGIFDAIESAHLSGWKPKEDEA